MARKIVGLVAAAAVLVVGLAVILLCRRSSSIRSSAPGSAMAGDSSGAQRHIPSNAQPTPLWVKTPRRQVLVRRLASAAALAAALALALALVAVGQASKTDIYGSAHDLGSPGNPACSQCHISHNAQGAYLWARTPGSGMTEISSLCFSCHDGTTASQWIAEHATPPADSGATAEDCDFCHDAHGGDDFLRFAINVMAASSETSTPTPEPTP